MTKMLGAADEHELTDLRERLAESQRLVESLERRNQDLTAENRRILAEGEAKRQSEAAAIGRLRKMLQGPFNAMRVLFGELEKFEPAPESSGASTSGVYDNDGLRARWSGLKARMSPSERKVVDVLLDMGEATVTQLAASGKMHYDTAKAAVRGLGQKGLLVKNGKVCTLKTL